MRAIIFDMDGVLIDSEPLHRRVEQMLFREFSVPVSSVEHLGYLGMSSHAMFSEIAVAHPREWNAAKLTVDFAVREERRRYLYALREQGIPFVPGSVEFVHGASAAGWHVAVASSAPLEQINLVLENALLCDVVTCVRSGDDVTNGKPHPEIFLSAAACLGVSPEDCWVVEDSSNGVQAALSAGMRCVGFANSSIAGARLEVSAATIVATSTKEVAAAIDPTLAGT